MGDRATRVGLTSAAEAAINPATKENQDTMITLLQSLIGFDIPEFDYVSLGYTGENVTTVVYKVGGAGGTTVRTLTLAYSGSNLTSVTAS